MSCGVIESEAFLKFEACKFSLPSRFDVEALHLEDYISEDVIISMTCHFEAQPGNLLRRFKGQRGDCIAATDLKLF